LNHPDVPPFVLFIPALTDSLRQTTSAIQYGVRDNSDDVSSVSIPIEQERVARGELRPDNPTVYRDVTITYGPWMPYSSEVTNQARVRPYSSKELRDRLRYLQEYLIWDLEQAFANTRNAPDESVRIKAWRDYVLAKTEISVLSEYLSPSSGGQ
jgi:hypothetical protein